MYPDGYPDFPMAQLLETQREEQRVTVSCLVSDLRFEWRLEPAATGTLITVDVEIPEAEAHRLDTQREVISASMRRLAELAAGVDLVARQPDSQIPHSIRRLTTRPRHRQGGASRESPVCSARA